MTVAEVIVIILRTVLTIEIVIALVLWIRVDIQYARKLLIRRQKNKKVKGELQMICPKCGSLNVGVTDTVKNPDANEIYRRRKCKDCGKMLHTIEFEAAYDDQFADDWNKYHRVGGSHHK